MTKKIKQHLMENNSYFRWGAQRLAEKFNCSEKTILNVLNELRGVKKTYLKNLARG